jgi:predicted nucleic acid-binding protein
MTYLLDTNAISDLMRENPLITAHLRAAAASDHVVTSVIVHGEILHGLLRMPTGKRKDSL